MTEGIEPVGAAELLVDARRLQERARELGDEISRVYADSPDPLVAIGILKGSTPFLADLVRAMSIDVEVDFMAISSYGAGGAQSGIVRILKDIVTDISGRDVLIVEDIVDTGLTLNYLRKTLGGRAPRSLRTVTLLDKRARRIVPVPVEHTGFEIPDVFVVGYGLDFQGLYRNVPQILAVADLPRLANEPRLLCRDLFGPLDGSPPPA